jgi:hypothetical protein
MAGLDSLYMRFQRDDSTSFISRLTGDRVCFGRSSLLVQQGVIGSLEPLHSVHELLQDLRRLEDLGFQLFRRVLNGSRLGIERSTFELVSLFPVRPLTSGTLIAFKITVVAA